MEHVTRESVLKDALRLYFEGRVRPFPEYAIELNQIDADTVEDTSAEDVLRTTDVLECIADDCAVCALGGMLYAYLLRKPKTLRDTWPCVMLRENIYGYYSVEFCGPGSDEHGNYLFVALEELFTREELHRIERAFELHAYSVSAAVPMSAYAWQAAVAQWRSDNDVTLRCQDARYLQCLANALRNGGRFDPDDLRMLSVDELKELCEYTENP